MVCEWNPKEHEKYNDCSIVLLDVSHENSILEIWGCQDVSSSTPHMEQMGLFG